MSLLKPDIKKAFFDLLSCQVKWKHEVTDKQEDFDLRSLRAARFPSPNQFSIRNLNASSKSISVTANDDSLRTAKVRTGESADNSRVAIDDVKSTDGTAGFNRDQSHREADNSVEECLPVQRENFTFSDEEDDHSEAHMSVVHLAQVIETENYSTDDGVTDQLPV